MTLVQNKSGQIINPSTEEKQDDIISILNSNKALQLAESGVYTYVGKATIGSATSSAVWQIFRIDETSGLIILWADGNDNFDNIWDNYASLTYG